MGVEVEEKKKSSGRGRMVGVEVEGADIKKRIKASTTQAPIIGFRCGEMRDVPLERASRLGKQKAALQRLGTFRR